MCERAGRRGIRIYIYINGDKKYQFKKIQFEFFKENCIENLKNINCVISNDNIEEYKLNKNLIEKFYLILLL